MRLADAVSARTELDLRIGAAFTRLMTLAIQARIPELAQQVLSYGMYTLATSVAPVADGLTVRSLPVPNPWFRG